MQIMKAKKRRQKRIKHNIQGALTEVTPMEMGSIQEKANPIVETTIPVFRRGGTTCTQAGI